MTKSILLTSSFIILLFFKIQAQVDKSTLESHFRSGNAPGQSEFYDLINSCYNYSIDKGLIIETGTNSLRAEVTMDLLKKMLTDTARKNQQLLNAQFQTIQQHIDSSRNSFDTKLFLLETALQDTSGVLRQRIKILEENLIFKHEADSLKFRVLLSDLEKMMITKIDSLSVIQNANKEYQDLRMTTIETAHNILSDTVNKMKIKLDTLNYSEHNFTQNLKLKLDNIENGATRSDNNFADSLVTKLLNIEQNANNYQLPMTSHAKLGGVQLSGDFVLFDGKVFSALDPEKIDRWYATDTILNDWGNTLTSGQKWTKVRMKIPTGNVDAEGKKIYDFGEFNPPYKFIYDDLETSYYEYNGTDSSNVILGEHEKQKFFRGTKNTLIGHKSGYNLFDGGQENVIIGHEAGLSSVNVSNNVFIGSQSGQNIQAGADNEGEMNVAIGSHAMSGRNNNEESLALGFASMELGEQKASIAIGTKAMQNNSGENNIAIGYEAANSDEGSNNQQNINVGYRSGYSNINAQRNISIGDSTAFNNLSGKGNLFIGHGSGKSNTLGGNLFIGHDIGDNGSNKMLIGNNAKVLISGDFNSGEVNIDELSTSSIKIGSEHEVINSSAQFVGVGGVFTDSIDAKAKLNAAGVEIISKNGAILTERYALKSHQHKPVDFSTDASHRFVSDSEKSTWNNKVDKVPGKGLSSSDFTTILKTKLSGVEYGANKYTHPANHSASMIVTDANHQFVSETEKSIWTAGKIPIGGIIMWTGSSVPEGWALCDGSSHEGKTTPDLRGRFIVGSYPGKIAFEVGKSGGFVGQSPNTFTTTSNVGHSHNNKTGEYLLSVRDIPSHKHLFKNYFFVENSGQSEQRVSSSYSYETIEKGLGSGNNDSDNNRVFYKSMYTEAYGAVSTSQNAHTHSISSDGQHAHTITIPYYALAYIMRVK